MVLTDPYEFFDLVQRMSGFFVSCLNCLFSGICHILIKIHLCLDPFPSTNRTGEFFLLFWFDLCAHNRAVVAERSRELTNRSLDRSRCEFKSAINLSVYGDRKVVSLSAYN